MTLTYKLDLDILMTCLRSKSFKVKTFKS